VLLKLLRFAICFATVTAVSYGGSTVHLCHIYSFSPIGGIDEAAK
jgi:hypothetical protein